MHIFPESLLKDWSQLELRVMVLLSLSLQVILAIFGSRRKYMVNRWLQSIVWLAYMSVDTVATVSLGIITCRQGYHCTGQNNNVVQELWYAFLLLHLGGPDTITAYSVEDNELWLRHLITLVGQVSVAFYVFLMSQTPSDFMHLAILIFVVGTLKYGERIWVLRSASPKESRKSLRQRKYEELHFAEPIQTLNDYKQAHLLYYKARYLFAGLLLKLNDVIDGTAILSKKSATEAFHLVEIELGLVYGVIYTKASIIYSKLGIFLRLINFSCFIYSLYFLIIIGQHDYSKFDVVITYLLLVGAILLEIYTLYLAICSDWILPWVTNSESRDNISSFLESRLTKRKRWSGFMAQHNLMKFCLEKPFKRFRNKFATSKYAVQEVKDSLKEFIYLEIKKKLEAYYPKGVSFDQETQKKLLAECGGQLLREMDCLDDFREYTIDKVDFDHSILIWHIATCVCDHHMEGNHDNDHRMEQGNDDNDCDYKSKQELSRSISEYMLYLLVECPQMLRAVSGQPLYLDTCQHAERFFEENPSFASKYEQRSLDEADLEDFIDASKPRVTVVDGGKFKSQLNHGFILAQKLQNLTMQPNHGRRNKWKLISEMWVEMLIYAASHGEWRYHAQQLMKGGELLTLVALLSAHLGFSQQSKLGL